MVRRTRAAKPKETTDFLAGAAAKVPAAKPSRKQESIPSNSRPTQLTHVSVDAEAGPANTLGDLRASMLEDLAPKALKHLQDAINDTGDKFTPEYKHGLAMKLLDRVGAGKQDQAARTNARADLVTLRAASDRIGRILARAQTRSDAPSVEEMFG